jgi:hypothetical protein
MAQLQAAAAAGTGAVVQAVCAAVLGSQAVASGGDGGPGGLGAAGIQQQEPPDDALLEGAAALQQHLPGRDATLPEIFTWLRDWLTAYVPEELVAVSGSKRSSCWSGGAGTWIAAMLHS